MFVHARYVMLRLTDQLWNSSVVAVSIKINNKMLNKVVQSSRFIAHLIINFVWSIHMQITERK